MVSVTVNGPAPLAVSSSNAELVSAHAAVPPAQFKLEKSQMPVPADHTSAGGVATLVTMSEISLFAVSFVMMPLT